MVSAVFEVDPKFERKAVPRVRVGKLEFAVSEHVMSAIVTPLEQAGGEPTKLPNALEVATWLRSQGAHLIEVEDGLYVPSVEVRYICHQHVRHNLNSNGIALRAMPGFIEVIRS